MIKTRSVAGVLPAALAAVLAAAMAVSGVARAAVLDPDDVRQAVTAAVRLTNPAETIGKVDCPAQIRRRAELRSECTVDLSGALLVVTVTQTDRKGNVQIAATQAVITRAKAEAFVGANATQAANVSCGPQNLILRPPGGTFLCTTRFDDGTLQQVLVAVRDLAGTVVITQVY